MINGNPIWNQQVAAMTAQSRPLYTFEIPDEQLIITSFIPSEVDVTLDISNLVTQPLWYLAAVKAAALTAVSLPPVAGFTLPGQDGNALAVPPSAQVERFDFGSGITSYSAYLSWNGIVYPPGMQDIKKAVSIDLVMVSSFIETGGYLPYASVGYSVLGIPAKLATWFSALLDNTAGWTNRTDTLRLWPGNVDVGTAMPDINKIQIQVNIVGSTTGSAPDGITFVVAPTLLVKFIES
jgi:hypothetical protein